MPTRDRPTRGRLAAALAICLIPLAAVLVDPRPAAAQAPPPAAAEASIRKVFDDQVAAWNRGDLDGFLAGYWRSPKVVFQSGGTRHDGFDAMRDRYRRRYQADGRAMGQLAFADLEVETFSPDAAMVRGRYNLSMPDGSRPTGLFTLIIRRLDGAWKITHDHTSAADSAAPAAPATPAPGV